MVSRFFHLNRSFHMDGDHINVALRSYAQRIENLHDDRDAVNGDIREVYAEAKEAGFDTTILREIVRERRMEPEARKSRYQLLDEYRHALGMLVDTPLGEAAIEAAAKPKPFAEQPVKRTRGRPRKSSAVDDALAAARAHLGGDTELWRDQADATIGTA
jgi:uncharacterized protein (UPF0335 family)